MPDPQLHFFAKLGRTVSPDNKRTEPVIWFQELRVLKRLVPFQGDGDLNEVRRVHLHRGLNIVWAPPEESETPELYGDGLSGHASGKTLFCRVLRFLLGEDNYGPKTLRDAVAEKFKEGLWAIASVVVAGQTWAVARPLAGASHRFACLGSSIDEVLTGEIAHGSHEEFLTAISDATCSEVRATAGTDLQLSWRYLLPWLTRDQESRFSGLTEWRSTLAESENPKTSAGEQQELMKAVLGLLKADEIHLRKKLQDADDKLRLSNEKLPDEVRIAERDFTKLVSELRRGGMDDIDDKDAVGDLKERLRKRRDGITMFLEQAEGDHALVKSKDAWQKAVTEHAKVEGQITQATESLKDTTQAVAEKTSRHQQLQAEGIEDPSRYEAQMCPKTIGFAYKKGCVTPPPGTSLETDFNLGEILLKASELERLEAKQKQQLADLQAKLVDLNTRVEQRLAAYDTEKKRVAKTTKEQRQWLRHLDAAKLVAKDALASESRVAGTRKEISDAEHDQKNFKKELAALKTDHEDVERRLSNAFADIVRAAMGGKVEPSVKSTDRGFTLSVRRNAELSGAALETIKVLCFDLASMVLSVEGAGYHPRFLIHDGPREADLARLIYERFFLYARKLEESFENADAINFQYIITTTTAPPKDMQDSAKWLRMTLDTTKAEERFLREDL